MPGCSICGESASVGRLCPGCAGKLHRTAELCPEQIESHAADRVDAALIDQWGRVHALGQETLLGRDPGAATAIVVHQGSVSRRHARIDFDASSGAATLQDLGSTNGTSVGVRSVRGPIELAPGDTLWVGSVGLYYTSPIPLDTTHRSVSAATVRRAGPPLDFEVVTQVGLAGAEIEIVESTGGGGGLVVVDGKEVRLPLVQLELVATLVDRMRADTDKPGALRGYVHSSELLAGISWDTAHPDGIHIKQLVRRTRRNFERAGCGDLIESSQGLGYRLRVLPL